jgi:hypothetical protein
MRSLKLAKGTLDDRERAEIESHVEETFQFLDQIPLTEDLKNLASYAYGHRALQIIQADANAGLLDAELVRVMIASRAYDRILKEDWHRF